MKLLDHDVGGGGLGICYQSVAFIGVVLTFLLSTSIVLAPYALSPSRISKHRYPTPFLPYESLY